MSAATDIQLTTNVAALPGVGDRRADSLRALGIRCVADLLLHLPMRHEYEADERSIEAASVAVGPDHGAEASVTVRGTVATTRLARGRKSRFEATLEDGSGTLLLTWFNAPWLRSKLHPGLELRAWGKAKRYGDYLQIVNPRWEPIEPNPSESAADATRDARLRPVYPSGGAISTAILERLVGHILEPATAALVDHLQDDYRAERGLPALADSYRKLHDPADHDDVAMGRRRLAYDELLMLQLGVMMKRHHRHAHLSAPPLALSPEIDRRIVARFPFPLTRSQRIVIDEIAGDLKRPIPMNRLLQGDVGSGKTVVALYAMLLAVADRRQAALMAPTELLAEQHYLSITKMLTGSDLTIELLTGSVTQAARRDLRERLQCGAIDMVIGTHALVTESVAFNDLAVVVIDEQHRFGVHQRAMLRAKGDEHAYPHTLVMTATPIPRTLSLTVFGDLDVSTIAEPPPGRIPITSERAHPDNAAEVYARMAARVAGGEQAYVVVPVIEESETGLVDLTGHLERLRAGPLRDHRIDAVHGRMKRDEREEVMRRFRDHEIDVLLATTVIEVGVDVPNASMIVIENADRFGLAQLHQLRGRVGRGNQESLCVLIGDPATDDGEARLAAIASTTDGFRIAERDLEIRGPGELFGARQSGLAPFRVAQLPDDLELLRLARRDAAAWIEDNPTLAGERDALLKRRLLKLYGDALGLGDVA